MSGQRSRSSFRPRWVRCWCRVAAGLAGGLLAIPNAGAAGIVQVPEGGVPVPVIDEGVVCGAMAPGWALEGDGRRIQPPREIAAGQSRQFAVRVAASESECATTKDSVTLIATAKAPGIDPASVTFYPGEGRLEIKGRDLQGMQLTWTRSATDGAAAGRSGLEACVEAAKTGKGDLCVIPVAKDLRADAEFFWLPGHGSPDPTAITFDGLGNKLGRDTFRLRPARVVLPGRLLARDGIDISRGPGVMPLLYPEAVAAVDCGPARCDLGEGGVVVRAVTGAATSVTMRLRLAPRMVVPDDKGGSGSATVEVPLLACPLSIVSGSPLRDVAAPRLVVRLDARCGGEAERLHFSVAGEDAEVERVVRDKSAVFILLRTERITRDKVTVTAARAGLDRVVIGSATQTSQPAPQPRVSLELVDHGKIPFIPNNRSARVTVAPAGAEARFVLVPVAGAYTVRSRDGHTEVRGDTNAGGFATLQFAYLMPTLPGDLAAAVLAIIAEPVQRQVRDASVPAPFGASLESESPLVEFLCGDAAGRIHRVPPGKPWQVPFVARETCRVVVHRERLRDEDGFQEVMLEVDVTAADNSPRPGAQARERMVLRPGVEPRVFWVRGGIAEFDRISVRITHIVDEERYVISPTTRAGLPSAQWSAVVEGGRIRIYATAAIPAGLFRATEPSGQLRLNFGVISRLTWLDRQGKEGLLGVEVGLMGMGLITDDIENWPPTLGLVTGLGLRVPLGNGAAVGVHGWMVVEFRDAVPLPAGGNASHVAFVFGPSISIGNVGTNL